MAKLYKSNGDIVDVEPKNGRTFMLEELRELLTCDLVEPVFLKGGKIMLVDEEVPGRCCSDRPAGNLL